MTNKSGLEKLIEYKEFVAILVFFAGGLFWIYGYFATKNQVDRLSCVMEQNIQMLRGKMEYQYFIDLLEENKSEIKHVRKSIREAKKNNQPFEKSEELLLELEEQRTELKSERNKFKTNMETALNKLTKSECASPLSP